MRNVISYIFLEYGTKLKIHSEINPPLNPNNILFYIYHSLVGFSENGTKLKMPSEINPPLNPDNIRLYISI